MRKVTVSVSDEVYRLARVRAAEQGTSVSGLVAAYLRGLSSDTDAEFERLRALQRRITGQITAFSAADRISRDEVHGRATLR